MGRIVVCVPGGVKKGILCEMAETFISYRREDAAGYAGRLHESLERRLGPSAVFRDVDTLRPGQDFVQAIETRLASCRVLFVVIGREWLDARSAAGARRLDDPNDFVRLEVATALNRADVLVVPVLVEGASMPVATDLPDNLRMLARRHAVTVRDETWDADVDRLAAIAGGTPPRRHSSTGLWAAIAAVLVLLVTGTVFWRVSRSNTSASPVASSGDAAAPRTDTPGVASSRSAPSHPIAVPAIAQAAFSDLIYTVTAASVTPRGSVSDLDLQVRLMNRGRYDANFWDASFRLVAGEQTIAPTSGLNEIAAGNASHDGHVVFPVPAGTRQVVLRVLSGDKNAEIPLDLTSAPGAHPPAGTSDRPLPVDRAPLLQTGNIRVELMRATSHRFANTERLELSVRFTNRGRYPIGTWSAVMRVEMDGELLAPWDFPSDAVNPDSPVTARVVFDLPPDTTRAVLRISSETQEATRTFELP
jgi:hypothetical protein